MSIEARLKELGIELPPAKPPLYAYVPVVVEGGLAWVSGQLPWTGDTTLVATGKLGAGVDIPTVSRWLGHRDGGALAMKVYGHLRDAHSATAAAKVTNL